MCFSQYKDLYRICFELSYNLSYMFPSSCETNKTNKQDFKVKRTCEFSSLNLKVLYGTFSKNMFLIDEKKWS